MPHDDGYEGDGYLDGPALYCERLADEIIHLDPSLKFEVESLLHSHDKDSDEIGFGLEDLYELVAHNEVVYGDEVISPWKSEVVNPPSFKEFALHGQQGLSIEAKKPSSYTQLKYKIGTFCLNINNIFRA
jgi:hypothetical protein